MRYKEYLKGAKPTRMALDNEIEQLNGYNRRII